MQISYDLYMRCSGFFFSDLASICQSLDVTINKPFKNSFWKEWHIWMAGGGAKITASGNFCYANLSDICEWVKRTWEGIPDEMIIKSFKTCGISTSLDETDNEITNDEDSDNNIIGSDIEQ
jgi:hypothetical protein